MGRGGRMNEGRVEGKTTKSEDEEDEKIKNKSTAQFDMGKAGEVGKAKTKDHLIRAPPFILHSTSALWNMGKDGVAFLERAV